MKKGIRILGVDDSAFSFEDKETAIYGVVYRGTQFIEEIVRGKVTVDGEDSTEQLTDLYNRCNNHKQLKVIIVDGLSFGGLNPIRIDEVAEKTGKPVISTTTNRPDRESFRSALKEHGKHHEYLEELGTYSKISLEDGDVYFQYSGTDEERAREFIRLSVINGRVPEPVRVAHMIGNSSERN